MPHICSLEYRCKTDLNAAVAALEEATRLLSASMASDSTDFMELCFAAFRGAKAKTAAALAACLDHFSETETA